MKTEMAMPTTQCLHNITDNSKIDSNISAMYKNSLSSPLKSPTTDSPSTSSAVIVIPSLSIDSKQSETADQPTSSTSEDVRDEKKLRDNLVRLMIGDNLRLKVQYMESKFAMELERPVDFKSLESYFQNKHGRQLNIYYTTSSKDLMVQIRNQTEFDHVVQLYDRNANAKRMRLILSARRDEDETFITPPLGVYHGHCETTLSETSSVLSTSTSAYTASRLARCVEDEATYSVETPRPPLSWREGRCLGRGAFGQVFMCLNTETGEQLAVKKIYIRGDQKFRSKVITNLENELNLLSTLRHPNIVRYFGVQERPNCVNIFMELMTGSLKDQINDYGALSEQNTVRFTAQILKGLAYLHSRDIVHRDIKSANILIHSTAAVKIADFGSAKHLQAVCSAQGVDIMGTPHYNAPEIVKDSKKYGQRSDIWSVGITIVEMLTTKTPWADVEPNAVHIRIAFEKPPYNLPPKTSAGLVAVLDQMLEMQPENRPSAVEILTYPSFASTDEPPR